MSFSEEILRTAYFFLFIVHVFLMKIAFFKKV